VQSYVIQLEIGNQIMSFHKITPFSSNVFLIVTLYPTFSS